MDVGTTVANMQRVLFGIRSNFNKMGVDFSRADAAMAESVRLVNEERYEEALQEGNFALRAANEAVIGYTQNCLGENESEIESVRFQQLAGFLRNAEKKLDTPKAREIGPGCRNILDKIHEAKKEFAAAQEANAARIKKILVMLDKTEGTIQVLNGAAAYHLGTILNMVKECIKNGNMNGSTESLMTSFQDFVAKFHVAMR